MIKVQNQDSKEDRVRAMTDVLIQCTILLNGTTSQNGAMTEDGRKMEDLNLSRPLRKAA